MPITKAEFKKGNFKTRHDGSLKKHPVAKFLKQRNTKAYRVDEICKALKMNKNTVRGAIKRLKKANYIAHKSPYFVWR